VAIWLAAVHLVVLVLNSPPVRTRVARKLAIMAQAAFGVPVGIGAVKIDLFPARLVMRDLSVGAPDHPVLAIRVIELGAGELRLRDREFVLRDLSVRGVRIHAAAPADTGRSGGKPWLRLVVEQLLIEDVEIERLQLPSGLVLAARAVEARWSSRGQERALAGVVYVSDFAVTVPGLEPVRGSLSGWGRLSTGTWEIGRLRGRGEGWQVDFRGGGHWVGGTWRTVGQAELDLAVLDRVVGIGAGLAGSARLSGDVGGTAVGPVVAAHVVTGPVLVAGFALDSVEGDVQIDAAGLDATDRGMWGGAVVGHYALGRLDEPWPHRVRATGTSLAVPALLGQLGVDSAGLAGSLDGELELAWSGRLIGAGLGRATATVRPGSGDVPAAGTVVLTMDGDGALRFATEGLTLAGAPASWRGPLTLGSWVPDWRLEFVGLGVPVAARLLRGWVGEEVLPAGLDGAVTGAFLLSGPFTDLRVEGSLESRPLSYGPISFDAVTGSFRVEDGVLLVDQALGMAGTGRLEADGELVFADGALRLDLAADRWPLERLAQWAGLGQHVAGTVDGFGTLSGRLDAPAIASRLTLADVAFAGVPFGGGTAQLDIRQGVARLNGLRVGPLAADGVIAGGAGHAAVEASLARFQLDGVEPVLARLAGGPVDLAVRADFPFARPAGRFTVAGEGGVSGFAELDGDSLRVSVERLDRWRLAGEGTLDAGGFDGRADVTIAALSETLTALAGEPVGLDGRVEASAHVTFSDGAIRLSGQLGAAEVEVGGQRAALTRPAVFSFENGDIRVPGLELAGEHASLFLRGGRLADGALFGNFAGELSLATLALLWPDSAPRGRVEAIGELSGTDAAPRLEGTARVADGVLRLPGFEAPVTGLAGFVELAGNAIRIDGLRFSYGSGSGVCNGRVLLAAEPELDLSVDFENLRYPLTTDLAPRLTGSARLTGPLSDLLLGGRATLLRTVYRRDVSLEKLVAEQFLAPERVAGAVGAVRLDLQVAVPGTLVIETTLASLTASGELRVVGNSSLPGLVGRLEALPGAEAEVLGTRYELDRAVVEFSNPSRIEPVLDVLARTDVQDVQITVGLTGLLDRLSLTLNSSPPMPEMDVLSLLVTGERADSAAPLQTGAMASTFLTGQLASAATRRARTLLDLQEFRVDPYFASESGQPAARVTVTKRLSPKWTVTVASNLESNREEVVKTRWRVAPGVYVEAERDQKGAYSLDVKWLRRY
jgi:autotransporter translocation and assembly factor TamB